MNLTLDRGRCCCARVHAAETIAENQPNPLGHGDLPPRAPETL